MSSFVQKKKVMTIIKTHVENELRVYDEFNVKDIMIMLYVF